MHGHGKDTIGGTGGRIVRVTSLADSGPGTLREAINLDYPRIIKFDVSGIITLEQIVFANNGFCTLDGTGANVCLRGAPLRICSPEWIVYNMRFRPGDLYTDSSEGDGLSIAGINPVYNIYIDSCSFSWAQDETLSIWGGGEYKYRPHNITITNCIIAEALAANDNSYGALVGYADKVSLINNVIAYNRGRSPFIENAVGVELINNRIAYWTYEAVRINGYCEMDIIGNTFTDNSDAVAPLQFAGDAAGKVHLLWNPGLWHEYTKSAVKFPDMSVASSGEIELSDIAGALPLDAVDTRILYNIENGLRPVADAWTINSQADVGGWPEYLKEDDMETRVVIADPKAPVWVIVDGIFKSKPGGSYLMGAEVTGYIDGPAFMMPELGEDRGLRLSDTAAIEVPPSEPPVEPSTDITPPDEFTARWKDASGNVVVTREYKRV